jgi:microcystin-dependent protein
MALLHYLWSRTAASNSTADSNVNWAEGQAPSSVNDSARAMMASAAGFRDDIAGAIVTGGTSTAYTVSSYQVFDTLAHMSGQMIAFSPHTTNGATVTLNVDGLGAKPLRQSPSVELPAGVLIQGSPYVALYNNSDAAWYLQNFYINPYSVPVGGMIDFVGTTAPNSAFVLPFGQAISRTTYATLFAMVSTTYGIGDGSTTFNVPDLRGRVIAGKDDMGGSSANRLTAADDGLNGDTLGATGGGETQTLVTGNLPAYTPAGSITVLSSLTDWVRGTLAGFSATSGASVFQAGATLSSLASSQITSTGTLTGTAQGGTSTAFGVVQPTIILSKILRVI